MADEPKKDEKPQSAPKTGAALVEYLRESGTPPTTLELVEKLAPSATGEQVYLALEGAGVTEGTIRKAGKWLYGETWDTAKPGVTAPEEILRLREEVGRLKASVHELQGRSALMLKENRDLRERLEVLGEKREPDRIRQSETQMQGQRQKVGR